MSKDDILRGHAWLAGRSGKVVSSKKIDTPTPFYDGYRIYISEPSFCIHAHTYISLYTKAGSEGHKQREKCNDDVVLGNDGHVK